MQPEGSSLLQMLEEVMTMDRNAMGHTLVRFYLAHGSVLPLLDMLTIREIHLTSEGMVWKGCVCVSGLEWSLLDDEELHVAVGWVVGQW